MQNDNFLDGCLMDCDVEAKIRTKHRRQRAVVIAISVEAALVAGLALWPIVTTGSAPAEIVMLPRIPYHGSEVPKPATARQPARAAQPQQDSAILFQPQRIPPRIDRSSETMGNTAPPVLTEPGPGVGTEMPGPPFGTGNDASMIPRPPTPPRGPRIIHQTEGVQSGMLIYRVKPLYPQLAMNAGISGTVELRAIIGRDGRVRSVEVLSGSALLASAAISAVKQWRYRPTLLNGEAVEVETRVTVHFVIGQ